MVNLRLDGACTYRGTHGNTTLEVDWTRFGGLLDDVVRAQGLEARAW